MSLDAAQRARTADEFAAALARSGLTREGLRAGTGLDRERFDAALEVRGGDADPRDVWLVRDALETAVRDANGEPVPFSVLTEEMRSAAAGWFGVRDRRWRPPGLSGR